MLGGQYRIDEARGSRTAVDDQSRLRTFHLIVKSMNQSAARAACRANYTDLVTVYSDEVNTALTNLISGSGAWIGLNRNTDLTLNYHLTSGNTSWNEAQSYCRNSYPDLVSIRDQNQNEAVKVEGLKSSTSFWIGLLRDDWEWTDGGRSAHRNWGTGQLRLSTDCVYLRKGKWETVACSNQVLPAALCSNTKS
ncbi:hypothetical protein MHYP_G00275420 [Metynnis hypsauchen]